MASSVAFAPRPGLEQQTDRGATNVQPVQTVHLDNFDLNLLRVFEALMEERSATRAGSRLGLSQSAISHGAS